MKYKRGALGHFSRCPCNYGLGVPTAGSAVSRQSSGTASAMEQRFTSPLPMTDISIGGSIKT